MHLNCTLQYHPLLQTANHSCQHQPSGEAPLTVNMEDGSSKPYLILIRVHLSLYLRRGGRKFSCEYFTFLLIIWCTIRNGTCNILLKDFQGQETFSAKSWTDVGKPVYAAYLPSVNPQPLHPHCFLQHTLHSWNPTVPRPFLEPAPTSLLRLLLTGTDLLGPTVHVQGGSYLQVYGWSSAARLDVCKHDGAVPGRMCQMGWEE